jgi:hypothetical protein
MVDDIQQGIIDFAKEYRAIFAKHQYMYQISGEDAYRPFYCLTENLDFFANNFEGILMPEGVGRPSAARNTVQQKLGSVKGGE